MTKEEIDKIVGRELDKNSYSLDKKIYNGVLYFYKREILQDHYFYVPAEDRLYLMKYNSDNHNPAVSDTASKPDSFQYDFEYMKSIGAVVDVTNESTLSESPYPAGVEMALGKSFDGKSVEEEIDDIIMQLMNLKKRL